MFRGGMRRFGILRGILYFYLLSNSGKIFADTVLLRDGKTVENVKTSLRADHILVVDETGKTEKIDLTLVEKILISEIKKSEVKEEKKEDKNIKKFYFSLNGSAWSSQVTEKPSFNRGYNLTDILTMVVNIDPYFEKKYSVDVKTVSFNGEYRRSANFGFSLGLEQNSYSFPDRNISPWIGLVTNANLNSTPEYQMLAGTSLNSFLFNQLGGNFKNDKHGKFTIATLSLSPGVKYYVSLSDSIFWFVQGGFGFGKSYESGIYSKPLTQTALFAGTGVQWESESYFFNITLQYRKTDLKGSVYSYRFNEPIFMIGGGLKL
ncbi:hypothetical protein [Leptospira alstonii]|uniref:Outer membrane protein beta-barrel domain protein n=2 Tax=Leptospira alstonii TaxID=28452 RepID=M6D2D9_9LEPT|nr:hypothetical protein [Leptospira alstonii]EMJ98307.1 hypothetical protein LEP1GSC194_0912 [Leptospira alstonii serovar Sichuan str. 79601]EQA82632.1 hypothetical protein LEP1GSC193_1246 [Leptospira alstonii serovar Pingchang str. 80-412]